MAIDSALVDDTCPYLLPGAAPNWWASDDIKIIGPNPSGIAIPGQINRVQVTTRRKGGDNGDCSLPDNTDFFRLELYVCNPTGSPLRINSNNVKKIFDNQGGIPQEVFIELTDLLPGGTFANIIHWKLPDPAVHPAEGLGHKCLIARIYSNANPMPPGNDIGDYAASQDQHYAQRNICIGTCASPCGVDVWTENLQEEAVDVTFRLVVDTRPSEELVGVLTPLLQPYDFMRFSDELPPAGYGLEFADFPDLPKREINDPDTDLPGIEVDVRLEPGSYVPFRFVTDLEGSEPGTAHLFHLKHVEQGAVLSGLTIVMIKTFG
jgi:hypothetical protein